MLVYINIYQDALTKNIMFVLEQSSEETLKYKERVDLDLLTVSVEIKELTSDEISDKEFNYFNDIKLREKALSYAVGFGDLNLTPEIASFLQFGSFNSPKLNTELKTEPNAEPPNTD